MGPTGTGAPARGDRGHVIDHGYMWLVPKDKEAAVLASVQAGDDAQHGNDQDIGQDKQKNAFHGFLEMAKPPVEGVRRQW